LPEELSQKLAQSDSTLMLLTCGAAIKQEEPRNQFFQFAKKYTFPSTPARCHSPIKISRNIFKSIWAFNADDFIPHMANKFCQDIAINHFVTRRGNITPMLLDNCSLGAHTDVIHIRNGKALTYIWSHPVNRPFGQPMPLQCRCKSVRSWGPADVNKKTTREIEVKCKHCGIRQIFIQPKNMTLKVRGSQATGDWYAYEELL
jgi:hypothetical protein